MKIIQNSSLSPEVMATLSADDRDWIYNGLDCCVTHEIFTKQLKAIKDTAPYAAHTSAFSHALMAPIFEMTLRGTKIDLVARDEALCLFRDKRRIVAENLTRIVEEGIGFAPFNYRSHVQLKKLFYQVMGFKAILKRNANGIYAPSVDREALEKLQKNWTALPLTKHLLILRELDKKIQFLETPLDDDGRMRTSYNIAGTNTGRLSSSESDYGTGTNQQNIERALRKMFIPDPGYKFCNIDLEQADARNVGAICWELFVDSHGEEYAGAYLNACESGDLHTTVCRMAWRDLEWPEERKGWRAIADQIAYRELSYRDMAKKLGHGTNYYGTPRTMAMHTKVETKLIEQFQIRYFDAFPVIGQFEHVPNENWHTWVRQQLIQYGYIETPYFKRRRYFYGRPEEDKTLREAIAYAPQSMTADEIDTGILNIWRHLPQVQLLIQVHDSILFQYPAHLEDTIVPTALDLLTIKMQLKRGREFYVPAEAKIGWNWADAATDNESGLIKWKGIGVDERECPVRPQATSLRAALNVTI